LVTREQLRQRLWPDGTYVDFDHGPSSTQRSARDPLSDSSPIARWPGMAISPDGRWILYTQVDHRSGDIMLVENFH
jgi:hypothetical protein